MIHIYKKTQERLIINLILWRYTVVCQMTTVSLVHDVFQEFTRTLLRYPDWSKANCKHSDFMRFVLIKS
jgi:hypothetical protein